MLVRQVDLEASPITADAVVVINVLRAFTTACWAFAAGAATITVVARVEEAFSLRTEVPGSLITGEVDARKVEGFDFGNSPIEFDGRDLAGRHLIQRTSAGTQGIVRYRQAPTILAASLCCVSATVERLRQIAPRSVALVISGSHSADRGEEDRACADLLAALLVGGKTDREATAKRVRSSAAAAKFLAAEALEFPAADLDCALQIDRFGFALPVRDRGGRLVMEAAR